MNGPRAPAARPGREAWILAGVAALALLPYAAFQGLLARLFWFGDEFDLIDQFDRRGFWPWVWQVFAENFVPVFKVLWGGAVLAGGGSYAVMIALVWLTHGATTFFLGRLLRAAGMGWPGVVLGQLLFGLAACNYETLTWSVQWSAVLALTFQLAALDACYRRPALAAPFVGCLLSALSFSRGVLTGPLVALADLGAGPRAARGRRAALLLAPAVLVAGLITVLARGNHQHMQGHWGAAAGFGLWYFCLNPAHELFEVASWGWRTTLLLGALKCALWAWALRRSGGRLRGLLAVLLAFDLGNAALLGVGRYHTGLVSVVSSRYQYASLAAVAPLAGWAADRLGRRLAAGGRGRALLAALGLGLVVLLTARWPRRLEPFTAERGTASRRLLFTEPAPAADAVPGIPFLPMDRAKQIIAKYHLH